MLRKIFFVLFGIFVFVAGILASLFVHSHLDIGREAIADTVNEQLESSFRGQVRIDGLDGLGPGGVKGVHVTVFDPDGVIVLVIDHADVDISIPELAFERPLAIDRVRIANADVLIDPDMRIGKAFASKNPSKSKEPSTFKMDIRKLELVHAWIHGEQGSQPIDAEVFDLDGALRIRPEATTIAAALDAISRALPKDVNPRIHAEARAVFGDVTHILGRVTGDSRGLWFGAQGSLDDKQIAAYVLANGIVPEVPGAIDLGASIRGTTDTFVARARGRIGEGRLRVEGRKDRAVVDARLRAKDIDLHAILPSIGRTAIAADLAVHGRGQAFQAHGTVDPQGAHVTVDGGIDERLAHADVNVAMDDATALLSPFDPQAKHAGRGTIHATGSWHRDSNIIAANVHSNLDGIARDDIRVERLGVEADAAGPIANPRIATHVRALGATVPKAHLAAINLDTNGHLRDANVHLGIVAKESFDLNAHVAVGEGVRVDNLDVAQNGMPLLRGLVHWDGTNARVKANMDDVDLAHVAKAAGIALPLGGRLSLATDATVNATGFEGFVTIDARKVVWDRIQDVGAYVSVAAHDNHWSAMIRGHLSDAAWVSIDALDLAPHGSPFAPDSWRDAAGNARIVAWTDLPKTSAMVMPTVHAKGRARIGLVVDRPKRDRPPSLRFEAKTNGLYARTTLDIAQQADEIGESKLEADVDVAGTVDDSGRFLARIDARNGKTTIGSIDLGATLPWTEIVRGNLPTEQALLGLPLTLDADVPFSDVRPLCKLAGVNCRGRAGLVAHVDGPIKTANGTVKVTLAQFKSNLSPVGAPIDATIDATYQPGKGKVVVKANAEKTQTLDLTALVDIPADFKAWTASVDLKAKQFPVRTPVDVGPGRVKATLDGTARLTDFHRDARMSADLHLSGLDVAGVISDKVDIDAGYDGSTLGAKVHLESRDGGVDLDAKTKAGWGNSMSPAIDPTQPIEATLKAKSFRLKTLSPIMPATLGDIDGRIDSDMNVKFTPTSSALAMTGFVTVNRASVATSPIGELNDITMKVIAQPDGSIKLDDAHLRGSSGWINLHGDAHIANGKLSGADLTADIKRDDPFPLLVGGDHIGDLWGHVETKMTPHQEKYGVDVKVPTLHLVLPDTSRHSLQDLDPDAHVMIGFRDKAGTFRQIPLSAPKQKPGGPPIAIDVNLGDDVMIEQGETIRVAVSGRPHIEMAPELRVTGQVSVTHGTLDVSGKRFDIERGLVTFSGEPTNPTVFATASWKAPDGSIVYADYTGPVKNGNISLRAEPPHTNDEIVSLLVFGTTSGPNSASSQGTDTTTKAIGTAAGIATQPLNKALDQLTHMDIRTRVDTSSENPKPEVEVQLNRDLSAQIAYVLGQPPPGTNPDKYFFTVGWRISSKWTADATVGDRGSSIFELTWHHRY